MFRDEAERLRAREAALATFNHWQAFQTIDNYPRTFDRLFPVVEPAAQEEDVYAMMARVGADAFNSIGQTPSPAFAAAVAKFEDAVRGAMMSGDTWDIERADRARAALVRLWDRRHEL